MQCKNNARGWFKSGAVRRTTVRRFPRVRQMHVLSHTTFCAAVLTPHILILALLLKEKYLNDAIKILGNYILFSVIIQWKVDMLDDAGEF